MNYLRIYRPIYRANISQLTIIKQKLKNMSNFMPAPYCFVSQTYNYNKRGTCFEVLLSENISESYTISEIRTAVILLLFFFSLVG
jgi:hypothetical protein